jgi:hypothetical protein
LFRREALAAAGGFDPRWRYMIDIATHLQIAKLYGIAVIHEPLADFRVSSSSWSAALARGQAAEARQLFRHAASEAGVPKRLLVRGIVAARALQTVRHVVSVTTRWRARRGRP